MEIINVTTDQLTVPAGKYMITDPCYLFNSDQWSVVCEKTEDQTNGVLVVKVDNKEFSILWNSTRDGDGMYKVKNNNRKTIGTFGVDSGLFALIPLEFVEKYAKEDAKDLPKHNLAVVITTQRESRASMGGLRRGALSVYGFRVTT